MSESSESLHLRSESIDDVAALLGRAGVRGFVHPSKGGWTSFVWAAYPNPFERDERLDRIVAANRALLIHWQFAEDHGCNVTVYDGPAPVAKLRVSFESRRSHFDRAEFVKRGLLDERSADEIAKWITHADPNYLLAARLGLPRYEWVSFGYVSELHEDAMRDAERFPTDWIEVDAAGGLCPIEAPQKSEVAQGETSWDVLSKQLLDRWQAANLVELTNEAGEVLTSSPPSLVDALADVLAEEPSAETLEEWLLDRPEVAELFANGAELLDAARECAS